MLWKEILNVGTTVIGLGLPYYVHIFLYYLKLTMWMQ